MNNPFSYIISSLSSISRETAILEICDWDEEKRDKLHEYIRGEISSLDYFSVDKIEQICFNQNITTEESKSQLFDIIIQMMQIEMQQISNEGYEN